MKVKRFAIYNTDLPEYTKDRINCTNLQDFGVWITNFKLHLKPRLFGKINLILDSEDKSLITKDNLDEWNDRLNLAYESYADLTGSSPYNGGQISIQSIRCDKNSSWNYENWACDYWAWAGQLIGWSKFWVKGELQRVNDNDDWSFGILHEISHTFDNNNWNFDPELMANFKMAYFVEQNNAKVKPGEIYWIGSQIEDYYSIPYNTNLNNKVYNNDFLTYILLKRIKPQVGGWDTFKVVFRNLSTKSGGSPGDRLNAFLNEIDYVSSKNTRTFFTSQEKEILNGHFGAVF
jgi:hypothetical protein